MDEEDNANDMPEPPPPQVPMFLPPPPPLHGAAAAVLWDLENCAPPSMKANTPYNSGHSVVRRIRMTFALFGSLKDIRAYTDITSLSSALRGQLQSSGVHLIDVPARRKDAVDKMILADLILFAVDNPAPATLVLISGDQDYAYALAKLAQRGYRIVLVVPPQGASEELIAQADIVYEWRSGDLILANYRRPQLDAPPTEVPPRHSESECSYVPPHLRGMSSDEGRRAIMAAAEARRHLHMPDARGGDDDSNNNNDNDNGKGEDDLDEVKLGDNDDDDDDDDGNEQEEAEADLEMDFFSPIISIMNKLLNKRPKVKELELATIGAELRKWDENWMQKLGVEKLKDYVEKAVSAGCIDMRRQGLQNYVRLPSEPKKGDPPVRLEARLEAGVMKAVRAVVVVDRLLPTKKVITARLKEFRVVVPADVRPLRVLVASGRLRTAQHGKKELFLPADADIDPKTLWDMDFTPPVETFSHELWTAFARFILLQSRVPPRGRYKIARSFHAHLRELGKKGHTFGELLCLVNTATNKPNQPWFRPEGFKLRLAWTQFKPVRICGERGHELQLRIIDDELAKEASETIINEWEERGCPICSSRSPTNLRVALATQPLGDENGGSPDAKKGGGSNAGAKSNGSSPGDGDRKPKSDRTAELGVLFRHHRENGDENLEDEEDKVEEFDDTDLQNNIFQVLQCIEEPDELLLEPHHSGEEGEEGQQHGHHHHHHQQHQHHHDDDSFVTDYYTSSSNR